MPTSLQEVRMDSVGEAPQTGTTIVAVAFQGGVVLGADTRVTTGAQRRAGGLGRRTEEACAGTYISNRTSDKITPLADNVFLCRSGSAADTQAVSDIGTS